MFFVSSCQGLQDLKAQLSKTPPQSIPAISRTPLSYFLTPNLSKGNSQPKVLYSQMKWKIQTMSTLHSEDLSITMWLIFRPWSSTVQWTYNTKQVFISLWHQTNAHVLFVALQLTSLHVPVLWHVDNLTHVSIHLVALHHVRHTYHCCSMHLKHKCGTPSQLSEPPESFFCLPQQYRVHTSLSITSSYWRPLLKRTFFLRSRR